MDECGCRFADVRRRGRGGGDGGANDGAGDSGSDDSGGDGRGGETSLRRLAHMRSTVSWDDGR